jgi:hypothetical protein
MYKWNKVKYKTAMEQIKEIILWLSPRLESGFDEKPSKNAKISQNLTTWITSIFLRLGLLGGVHEYAVIAYVLANFEYVRTFVEIAYVFKYFKYAKG